MTDKDDYVIIIQKYIMHFVLLLQEQNFYEVVKMLNGKEAARMIDISAVRTANSKKDIIEMVEYARKYHFINVHVLPNWVPYLSSMLRDVDGTYVGSPVGFPSGGHCTEVKMKEAEFLIRDGVQEMDIVMNIGRLKNKEYDYVLEELKKIMDIAQGKVLTKVIIEINILTDDEMLKACELAIKSGADYVKTGTGWIPGGPNIERIRKICEFCGNDIKVKAAGGIRTKEDFMGLYNVGVQRMGINAKSAIEIVKSLS